MYNLSTEENEILNNDEYKDSYAKASIELRIAKHNFYEAFKETTMFKKLEKIVSYLVKFLSR